MAYSYIPVDRSQQFLVPPDVRDWLPPNHLAWFVIDVVTRLDTSALHARHPNAGVGRRAYDPDMLLALLIYAYCTGQRSSRQIERACETDVAYRVIAANTVPDHTTIARFRQDHEAAARQLFVDVLVLCAGAGLAQVGIVAVDGTKMAAAASSKTNRTRAQLEAEVASLFGQAADTDADEDRCFGAARGDELPAELADGARRAARLDAALAALDAQTATRRQAARQARQARVAAARRGEPTNGRLPGGQAGVAEAEARLAHAQSADAARWEADDERRRQAAAVGASVRGRRPAKKSKRTRRAEKMLASARRRAAQAPLPVPSEARVNVTDPDSRTMKAAHGFIQGYNAQAAANERGIVVAAEVSQDAGDVGLAVPMMAAVQATLGAAGVEAPVGTLLFDAGYCSAPNLVAPGPDRLIATTTRAKLRRKGRATEAPPDGLGPVARMEHRLRTPEGAALYAKRGHTIEPVFGDLKDNRGFRRFIRRGLTAVSAEWKLMAMTNNILKLHRNGVVLS